MVHTWRSSRQRPSVRNSLQKKGSSERDWITGSQISYDIKSFFSSVMESPLWLLFLWRSGAFRFGPITGCWPRNKTSNPNPHKNWYSHNSNLTMLCPDMKKVLDIFSALDLILLSTSNFTGAESRVVACRITGQDSSRQFFTLEETNGDWIPSRKGLYWAQEDIHMKKNKNKNFSRMSGMVEAMKCLSRMVTHIILRTQSEANIYIVPKDTDPVLPQNACAARELRYQLPILFWNTFFVFKKLIHITLYGGMGSQKSNLDLWNQQKNHSKKTM